MKIIASCEIDLSDEYIESQYKEKSCRINGKDYYYWPSFFDEGGVIADTKEELRDKIITYLKKDGFSVSIK